MLYWFLSLNLLDNSCYIFVYKYRSLNQGSNYSIMVVASHSFNSTGHNWSITEWEAYAIKWAILKFDYFLCNRTFVIFTDHRLLTYMGQRESNNAKIQRWQEEISRLKFELEYVNQMFGPTCSAEVVVGKGQKHQPIPPLQAEYLRWKDLTCIYTFRHGVWMKSTALQLIPKTHAPQSTYCHKRMADAFFAHHSTSTIPT